jgi:hypothetical protein
MAETLLPEYKANLANCRQMLNDAIVEKNKALITRSFAKVQVIITQLTSQTSSGQCITTRVDLSASPSDERVTILAILEELGLEVKATKSNFDYTVTWKL